MADRPILFSGPMVRALLAGTKTQTRRAMKVKPNLTLGEVIDEGEHSEGMIHVARSHLQEPRIAIGDRLWVREAHAILPRTAYRGSIGVGTIAQMEHPTDEYSAALFREGFDRSGRPLWRPSIHMPRWASRLTLTVTDVRVERLQDCSEDDAFAEGVETDVWDQAPAAKHYGEEDAWFVGWPMGILPPSVSVEPDEVCRRSYATLWDKINGAGAWASNPWVAAYTFTVHQGNIDAPA